MTAQAVQMPSAILSDDVAQSIYDSTTTGRRWSSLSLLEKIQFGRAAAAAVAYADNLRLPDQRLDLRQGAFVLEQARG